MKTNVIAFFDLPSLFIAFILRYLSIILICKYLLARILLISQIFLYLNNYDFNGILKIFLYGTFPNINSDIQ